ncbi:hypothetical protein Cylst_6691 (plasmid) [Cylindrospermum stagnale PCC 7417]|uniref:Uncharacterized protein n=1 Tax=Cylindrospermum stagnale PCC 7417 TaxID=56107 RepID=K9X8L2_9NOST|nr:hypothetical protein [Cylindrospermum stagnale]AFZ28444.1 hypothetical protein Cylst_6691 [Cylindrospermum stagnale PCC 7417]
MINAPLDLTATPNSENLALDATKSNAANTIAIFATEELTEEEERDRLHLERQVERAFYEAGKALRQLRDRKLYRNTHKTFEEYCKDRFSYNRSRSYQLIDAAFVVDNLEECPQIVDILPTAEGQVRPLTKLEAEEQVTCWQEAVESAGGKVPSGRIVKSIVDKIRERTKLPNPYRLGEVCQILPKDNPELKGKSGCWGIVTHLGDYSCTITTWDGEYTVKIENLKSLECIDAECEYMQQLCQRLVRLHQVGNLDAAVGWLLAGLGKRQQPFLTPLQEKLLAIVEEECGLI